MSALLADAHVNLTGGCLCRAVRFRVCAPPKASFACHCRDCQYVSGGAPAHVMVFEASAVSVETGTPTAFRSLSDSGRPVTRQFCATCGTPLFAFAGEAPAFLAVKVGALDDPSVFRKGADIWTDSAQPWHGLDRAHPAFPRDPSLGARALCEFARSRLVRLARWMGGQIGRPERTA